MKGVKEKEIADYFESYISRKFKRLVTERFFQGSVQTVQSGSGGIYAFGGDKTVYGFGGGPPFVVTVIRNGETTADGNTYQVLAAGYVPVPGDRVECVWRDQWTAYCLGPVAGKGATSPVNTHTEVTLTFAQPIISGILTTILFNQVLGGASGDYNKTNGAYTCPLDGRYLITARATIFFGLTTTPTQFYIECHRRTVALSNIDFKGQRMLSDAGQTFPANAEMGVFFSEVIRCGKGDQLKIEVEQENPANSTESLAGGESATAATFTYLGPL